MLTQNTIRNNQDHTVTIDDLVPRDHLLRKVDELIDFSFVYEIIGNQYSDSRGRPSIDPVVLIKYLLIGYLYGIPSERRIEQEIQVNMAYRWFLGLDIFDSVPDHSTISQNRRRRFDNQNIFQYLFDQVLQVCMENKLASGKVILTDSTHIKANASRQSQIQIKAEKEAYAYETLLDHYELLERQKLGLPPRNKKKLATKTQVLKIVSKTDPDAGFMKRSHKPLGMHYLSHQSVDAKHGIIVDVTATAGNKNDSVPYLNQIEKLLAKGLKIKYVGLDSGYDKSLIHKGLSEKGIRMCVPKNTGHKTTKVALSKESFQYDKQNDQFICPHNKALRFKNIERSQSNIFKIYRASAVDCSSCQSFNQCVCQSYQSRKIAVNIFEDSVQSNRHLYETKLHKRILNLRQIWCEGSFAIQKFKYNLKHLFRRGIEAANDHCLLSATALNLKRLIKQLNP